jgi:hypothetical protein
LPCSVPLSIHQTKQKTGSLTDPLSRKKTLPQTSVLAAALGCEILCGLLA